jgi:hypothetical protein
VHRPLDQEREDRRADVEASAPPASSRTALTGTEVAAWAEVGPARTEREPAGEPEPAAAHAATVTVVFFSVEPHDYLRSVVDSFTIYR